VLGDGEFCQRCTCMRCGSGLSKGLCLICKNNQNSLNDSLSISENSSQSPPHINHHCCYECGDPLDGIFCKRCTYKSPFTCDSTPNYVDESPNIFNPPPQPPVYSCEFYENNARYGHYCTPQVPFIYPEPCYNQDFNFPQDQAANARYWKIHACYDDDDDDYAFAIIPNEPVNSLSMGDELLDTISATKSNGFIKSSIKNLVPIPSESEGESECDVLDEDVPKKIYSNPLFDEEIIPMKIDLHHFNAESDLIESLLNNDSSIIPSWKIDSLFDEFAGELTLLKSIPPGIEETNCYPEEETHFTKRLLYDNSSPRAPKEFVSANSDTEIESFSPSPIPVEDSDSLMEEIDLSFTMDYPMPPGIEEYDYYSERDILILKDFLSNDTISLPEIESFHFDIPSFSRPPVKPLDGNTGILNIKMMGDISEQKDPMPKLMITLVPNQEKSPDLLSHQGLKAFQPSAK
nr:hypothetical protein [Tanacetum cinerariifolium]